MAGKYAYAQQIVKTKLTTITATAKNVRECTKESGASVCRAAGRVA